MTSPLLPLLAAIFLMNTFLHSAVSADQMQGSNRVDQESSVARNPTQDFYIHFLNHNGNPQRRSHRILENGTETLQEPTEHDYQEKKEEQEELPACNDILLRETAEQRCHHAKNCDGEYIMTTLLPLAFCREFLDPTILHSHQISLKLFPILFPVSLFLLTLLLFRLLGSTAENYFSPALEMISSEFRIPPPLAGVTLLALGNGAPDVSAVVNAIKISASEGIPLSLGELTGGGMFVQTIVVGRILFLGSTIGAGKREGVTCRGELIRDITMYAISAGYVFWMCRQGTIFYRHVVGMLLLYAGYVGVVVVFEIRRYYSNPLTNGGTSNCNTSEEAGELRDGECTKSLIHQSTLNFDEEDQSVELSDQRKIPSKPKSSLATTKQPDPPGITQSTRVLRMMQKQCQRQRQHLLEKRKSLVGIEQCPQDRSDPIHEEAEGQPWSLSLFSNSLHELGQHLQITLYNDIWSNVQLSSFEWFCLLLESPFIIIRKLVTPIPCEAEYHQSLVAYSIAFSPLWVFFYLSVKMDTFDPFCAKAAAEDAGHCFPSVFWSCCVSFIIGCAVIKYFPKEGASLPLRYSLPISLYGFLIAATWIDVISDQLVNVLEFIGVILRIPAPIMGMTVLAWGNSVGDYTTNGTLAQRGLADMSMAACFAGPSFNLLIGLGSGLLTQKESLLSSNGLPIALGPSVHSGFIFLICNCAISLLSGIWNKGIIPKMNGYIFYAMYFAYMTMNAQHLAI